MKVLIQAFLFALAAMTAPAALASTSHHVSRTPAQEEADSKNICSTESNHRLSQVELHGETRFTEFKFETDAATTAPVDFAEIGSDKKGRRHHRKPTSTAATPAAQPQMGLLLTMRGWGHEKTGWRNLLVRCGVHNGHLATFTYELLDLSQEPKSAPVVTNSATPPPTAVREPLANASAQAATQATQANDAR